MKSVNHGSCRQCGGPILYQGADFCSPDCQGAAFLGTVLASVSQPPVEKTSEKKTRTRKPKPPVAEEPRCVLCGEPSETRGEPSETRVCTACKTGEMDDG